MVETGWTTVTRGSGRDNLQKEPSVKKARVNWRDDFTTLHGAGDGGCWWRAPLHLRLITDGLSPAEAQSALTKDGKSAMEVERLDRLSVAVRSLTVEAFKHDGPSDPTEFDQPQSAFTAEEIDKLALTSKARIRNETDYINSILHPKGYGDSQAVLLLAKYLRIPDFAIAVPIVVNGRDRLLGDIGHSPISTDGKNMVLYHNVHYEAIIRKDVSVKCVLKQFN